MKKIIMADFMEYNDEYNKLGNYHYAKLFSQNGYEVLWISCPWNFLLRIKNKNVYNKRKVLSTPQKHLLDNNIFGFAPYSRRLYGNYPFSKSANILYNFKKYINPDIYTSLEKIGFNNVDVLWISNPKQYWLKDVVNYKKLVYRIADDFQEFKNFPKSIKSIDEKLICDSDLCLAVSQNLVELKQHLRRDIIHFPNGVELDNFIRNKYSLPNEYLYDDNKKVVYVGAVDKWFDIELVEYCAKKLTNVSFYIIGVSKIDVSKLSKYKNINLLGVRSYSEIPNYLYYSKVGIIPFKLNKLTDSVSPIKLYEYMSVGLNVVSTNFKEMQYINSPAYVAKNYDKFCDYIVQAIENEEKNKEMNIQFAKENTWEKRFKKVQRYL